MKRNILLVMAVSFLVLSCLSLAPTDPALLEKPLVYVVEVPGADKEELYRRARLWIAETYKSAQAVMSFEDPESGVIKGSGLGEVLPEMDIYRRQFRYLISIGVRDGKAKIEFHSFEEESYFDGKYRIAGINPAYQSGYDEIKNYCDRLGESFTSFMGQEPTEEW